MSDKRISTTRNFFNLLLHHSTDSTSSNKYIRDFCKQYLDSMIMEYFVFLVKFEVFDIRISHKRSRNDLYKRIENFKLEKGMPSFSHSHESESSNIAQSFYSVITSVDKLDLSSLTDTFYEPVIKPIISVERSYFIDDIEKALVNRFKKKGRWFKHSFPSTIYDPTFCKAHDDKNYFIRDNWENTRSFVCSLLAFSIGLLTLMNFVYKCNQYGIWYVVVYLLSSIFIGIPLTLLEMGYGQFTGIGCTKLFKMCPIFHGLGWSMILFQGLYLVLNGIASSWTYFYIFITAMPVQPWSTCHFSFNSNNCIPMNQYFQSRLNYSNNLATVEYWEIYVTKYRSEMGYYRQFGDQFDFPMWHLVLCLMCNWIVVSIPIIYGLNYVWQVLKVTLIIPFICSLLILILGFTLPGALSGLKYMLRIKIDTNLIPQLICDAIVENMLSLGLGFGGFITLSSLNQFRFNFIPCAITVNIINFFVGFFNAISVFCYLGYLSNLSNLAISKYFRQWFDIIFVIYPTALATKSYPNLWLSIYFIIIFMVCFNFQMMGLLVILIEIRDNIYKYSQIETIKPITVSILSIAAFALGLIFVTPTGIILREVIIRRVFAYGYTLTLISELIIIIWIYGINNIYRDFCLMSHMKLNRVFRIWLIIIPTIFICVLTYMVIKIDRTYKFHSLIPVWLDLIGFVLIWIILIPFQFFVYFNMIKIRLETRCLTFKEYLPLLFTPNYSWGPRFKIYGLFDKYYRTMFFREIFQLVNSMLDEDQIFKMKSNDLEFFKPIPKFSLEQIILDKLEKNVEAQIKGSVVIRCKIKDVHFDNYFVLKKAPTIESYEDMLSSFTANKQITDDAKKILLEQWLKRCISYEKIGGFKEKLKKSGSSNR